MRIDERQEDAATAALWDLGTSGLEVKPAAPGCVEWLAYFPDGVSSADVTQALASLPAMGVEEVAVPEVDWVERFREGFRGFTAGGFRVAPVWEGAAPGRDVLIVDPGRAFGTGTHESTRLCLAALEDLARRGPLGRVVDVGTGTGILAIAAVRLGAARAVASDFDPEAVASARRHADLNGVTLRVLLGDGGGPFRPAAFDVVLANISAPLLVERAAEIGGLAAPAGVLVLAGLLVTDIAAVQEAYAPWGTATVAQDGEWASLCVRRPAGP